MFGQQSFQPVIDMIIALTAEECAKEPWELEVAETTASFTGRSRPGARSRSSANAYAEPIKHDSVRMPWSGEVKAEGARAVRR